MLSILISCRENEIKQKMIFFGFSGWKNKKLQYLCRVSGSGSNFYKKFWQQKYS